jgi:hypothetical protein
VFPAAAIVVVAGAWFNTLLKRSLRRLVRGPFHAPAHSRGDAYPELLEQLNRAAAHAARDHPIDALFLEKAGYEPGPVARVFDRPAGENLPVLDIKQNK